MRLRRILLSLSIMAVLAFGYSQSAEFGAQYDHRGLAGYVYATTDLKLGYLGFIDTGLWLSPSAEITLGPDVFDYWVQAQLLVDTAPFTLSVRAKYEHVDTLDRWELRAGVLVGK